jgi:hypothetical protein
MSLQSRLSALITAIGADIKAIRGPEKILSQNTSFVETEQPTTAIEWRQAGSGGALLAKIVEVNPIIASVVQDRSDLRVRVKSRSGGETAERLILDSGGLSDFSTYTQGTMAARPGASSVLKGVYYYATDTGDFSFCTGAAWVQLAGPPSGVLQPLNGAFSNTYVNYTATSPFRYWKDPDGSVHIIGEINTSGAGVNTAGTLIITLPAGYRPLGRFMFSASTNAGSLTNHYELNSGGQLKVDANGANASSYANFGHVIVPTTV